jgi:asparagine synthase (glutamine-hydrolysing)
MVCDGEIFNYRELRLFLEARGHQLHTRSDAELIVHLYEELGERFVEELNGQFAIALWDRSRRRLLLARDRAGIAPLFHALIPEGLVFASEVKAILASGLVRPELDPDGLDELMTFWAPLAPRTMFRGIQQLAPGEMLIFEAGAVKRRRYWEWDFPPAGAHCHAPQAQLEQQLRELLSDAIDRRMHADAGLGAYLSGGLDSSSLLALAGQYAPEALRTFSIGFDDAGFDESAQQQVVAKYLGTTHRQVRCVAGDIADAFPQAIWYGEMPVLRAAPAPMLHLSSLAHQSNVRVVLTGEGADEVLGGYDIFKEAKVRQFWAQQPDSTWRPALLKRLYPYLSLTSAQSMAYLKEFFGIGLREPDDPCFSHLPRWATTSQCKLFWADEFRERVEGTAVERLRESLPAKMSGWHRFNRAEYLEATTLLPGYLLSAQGDRMSMANSVAGRFPFLDHRLIEFACQLHPRYKMRVLREKYLLKQAMRGRLPEMILGRHKQPYRAPDVAAFIGPNAPAYVAELLSPGQIKQAGYFDAGKVQRLTTKLQRTKVTAARDNMAFIGILSTQLWHAQFIAGQRFE